MPEVVLLHWPEARVDGPRLAAGGVPVLYLVNGVDAPPDIRTCLEDWVRIPGEDRDLSARIAGLEARATIHDAVPFVDDAGRLHHRGRLLTLPPDEAPIVAQLSAKFGEVVPDRSLATPDDGPSPELRSRIARLRPPLRDMGLTIHRVRGRGYRLQRR